MSKNLYIATYSNVDVYECVIDGIPLMRRVSDDWVNATQILKAGKFPKAHRTRILEKETQNVRHEKIQGGYGRFQGTWVPLEVARPFAHQHNVTDEMAPILVYQPDPNNPLERKAKVKPAPVTPQPDQNNGSPIRKPRKVYNTKRRRAAAAAAALLETSQTDIEDTSSQKIHNPARDSWNQNEPLKHTFRPENTEPNHHHPSLMQQQLPHQVQSIPHPQHMNTYQHQIPQHVQAIPTLYQIPPVGSHQYGHIVPHQHVHHNQIQQVQYPPQTFPYQQHRSRGSNENWSQDDASMHMDEGLRDSDTSISSEHSMGNNNESKKSKIGKASYTEALIHFFSNESDEIPPELETPPRDYDFNEPIDEEGHTPLHWATSMASTALIGLLLKNGADPLALNFNGLNAISRSVYFNNSFQKKNFHLIIDQLKPCIYTPDKKGRTPLHYICESNSSKSHISSYYLKNLLGKFANENVKLLRLVVNHKDLRGHSALDLAKETGNFDLLDILNTYQTERLDADVSENPDTTMNDHTESYDENDSDDAIEQLKAPSVPSLPITEVGPILTSMLSSLADAYDNELKNKEEEEQHTETVLRNLKVDISVTEQQNSMILGQLDSGSTYEELEANVSDLEDICSKKTDYLTKITERSQALGLAKLVLKEESSISNVDSKSDQGELAAELTKLQLKRNKMVKDIIQAFTNQNINNKMNNFRKLISISCGLKMESIDELIDEIEADLFTTVS